MRELAIEFKQLRRHGMAGAWADLVAQGGSAAIESARWLLEHLLQAQPTGRAMRSVSPQMHAAKFRVHRDLAGFDFEGSPVERRLIHTLAMPACRDAVVVPEPGGVEAEATRVLGKFLRDVMKLNLGAANFRIVGPDETASNRLEAVFEVSGKAWLDDVQAGDNHLSANGRVMEVLSEHLCQGRLEGYLLTRRHGLFSCYEAFIHIIDSMFNQHAKWLKVCNQIPWRKPIASLNYLLTSHGWRQDHNGFSHQDPGFIDPVASKKADVVRIYLPPDAKHAAVGG